MAIAGAAALFAVPASAHPSRGIAVDRTGTVYFSDLVRIWSIDRGRLRLVRDNRGNHTHAMLVDASGQLVWEESAYDPATSSYLETIWELRGGRPVRRFGPLQRPTRGLGIARDRLGCTFRASQAERGTPVLVHRLCPGRPPIRLVGAAAADARYRPLLVNDLGGVALDRGRFLFRAGPTVAAVDARGQTQLLASGLADENFGIAIEPGGGLLVAEHDRRRLIRVTGNRRQLVAASPAGWAPTGAAVGSRGEIYLLESTVHRPGQPLRVQVRRVAPGSPRLMARLTVPQP